MNPHGGPACDQCVIKTLMTGRFTLSTANRKSQADDQTEIAKSGLESGRIDVIESPFPHRRNLTGLFHAGARAAMR
jgi:hypothetical protein